MRYLLLLLIPYTVMAEDSLPLKDLLVKMAEEDQSLRKEIIALGGSKAPKALRTKLKKLDAKHTETLKDILENRIWLTKNEAGVEGIAAAFLIIQHSDDIDFKAKMLPHIKRSFLKGDGITGQQYALLTDRVRIAQGKKQLYGTQVEIKDGKINFVPIEENPKLDEDRKSLGLPPLDYYKRLLEEAYGLKDHPDITLN